MPVKGQRIGSQDAEMRLDLINQMVCPYCLGRFNVTHAVEEDAGRIRWGLLRCRCFEFPIVDGVLLLALVKGYGGSEEALAPYVPLQVAAIDYLRGNDVAGLRGWIERRMPLLHQLIAPQPIDYLSFFTALNTALWPQVEKDLFAWNNYEVLGRRGALRHGQRLTNRLSTTWIGYGVMRARRRFFPPVWTNFYLTRFITRDLANLRTRLQNVQINGPLLSLCCGHGPLELLLRGRTTKVRVVSLDGQVLNLFVVKRFIAPDASYICHDAQYSLPFADGSFSHVFSSTCLSEIPAQAHFVREACRVTSENGWTMFDTVTPDEAHRVVPTRFYRVCQNHFASLDDCRALMAECSGGRTVRFTPVDPPEPRWTDDATALEGASSASFILSAGEPAGFQFAGPSGFSAEERRLLAVNPRYDVKINGSMISGRLKMRERIRAKLKRQTAMDLPFDTSIDRQRLDEAAYLDGLYRSAQIVLLPEHFAGDVVNIFPS